MLIKNRSSAEFNSLREPGNVKRQFSPQLIPGKMSAGILPKTQLDGRNQFLCILIAVEMHIPALLNKPVFEMIERNLSIQVMRDFFANLRLCDHFDLPFTVAKIWAAHYMKPPIRIEQDEMRNLFNAQGYWDKTKSGEFTEVILEQRHPSLTAAHEPFCTHSQMISYRNSSNEEMARVHQYLRPDGTIGASGKPDPKRIYHNGILYRLNKKTRGTP